MSRAVFLFLFFTLLLVKICAQEYVPANMLPTNPYSYPFASIPAPPVNFESDESAKYIHFKPGATANWGFTPGAPFGPPDKETRWKFGHQTGAAVGYSNKHPELTSFPQ